MAKSTRHKNSRPIKFRGWTGTEMFYQDTQYLGSFVRRLVQKLSGFRDHESYLPEDIDHYLMQFTGLMDKDGQEIYEGDIVVPTRSKEKAVVVFDRGAFRIAQGNGLVPLSQFLSGERLSVEVIGNVDANPDLSAA